MRLNASQSRQLDHGNDLYKLWTRIYVTFIEIETNKMWIKENTKNKSVINHNVSNNENIFLLLISLM